MPLVSEKCSLVFVHALTALARSKASSDLRKRERMQSLQTRNAKQLNSQEDGVFAFLHTFALSNWSALFSSAVNQSC